MSLSELSSGWGLSHRGWHSVSCSGHTATQLWRMACRLTHIWEGRGWVIIPGGFGVNDRKHVGSHFGLVLFFFLIFIFTLFYFTVVYWFCHTLTWIHHGCTWVPKHEPPSHLPHHIISLDHPLAPAPSILYPASNIDWQFISYMILYRFHCHSPNHPTLSLSLRVQKSALHICVSFAVSHTGSSLPSF